MRLAAGVSEATGELAGRRLPDSCVADHRTLYRRGAAIATDPPRSLP